MMYRDVQTAAIMSAGMKLLRENLGVVEAEIFVTTLKNTGFDYTQWRQGLWEDLTIDEIFLKAVNAEEKYGVPDRVVKM